MQIIPPLTAHANVPHMFETPYDMIINGQIYDKATMKPKPYHFANINDFLPECNVFDEYISRIGNKTCNPDKGVDYQNIIQDTEDSSIFYVIYYVSGDSTTPRLSKIQKTENSYRVLQTTTYPSPNSYENVGNFYKFLCQTKDYILLSEAHYSWYSSDYNDLRNIIVRRVAKSDLSSVYTIDYANNQHSNSGDMYCFGCSHYLIKHDNSYAYLYVYFGDSMHVRKYNILNNTYVNLYTFSSEYLNAGSIGVSNVIKFKDAYYILTGNASREYYALQSITISDADVVSVSEHTLAGATSQFPYDARGYRTAAHGYGRKVINYLVYTLKNIDDKYIGLTVHYNEGFGVASNHQHVLLKPNGTSFNITHALSLPSCFGVLYHSPYISVVLTTEGFAFYRVNQNNDTWEEIRRESGTFNYIAFDSYRRFYTVNTAKKVSMYSNVSTYEIAVHFQHTGYQYQGQPIYTWCLVSAKNFLNDYIDTTLKVTLTGPVRFADGSTEKIIATQGDIVGEEVYICGSGQIGVHAIEVEGW